MSRAAFTLLELVLVMCILVVLVAVVAPALAKSMRGRGLAEEAGRFVALTEYARSEAVSQGVPTTVWAAEREYGFALRPGYEALAREDRPRTYQLAPEVRMELVGQAALAPAGGSATRPVFAGFDAAGTLETTSGEAVRFTDRDGYTMAVNRTEDALGYAVAKGAR